MTHSSDVEGNETKRFVLEWSLIDVLFEASANTRMTGDWSLWGASFRVTIEINIPFDSKGETDVVRTDHRGNHEMAQLTTRPVTWPECQPRQHRIIASNILWFFQFDWSSAWSFGAPTVSSSLQANGGQVRRSSTNELQSGQLITPRTRPIVKGVRIQR